MSLNVSINAVSVKAVRGPSRYFFKLPAVLEAAGVPEGLSREIVDLCRDSGHAVRRYFSGTWFVDAGGLRDYIARTWEGIPRDAAMTGDQRDAARFMDRLESCVADCERWAASRRIPKWRPAEEADHGIVVNGTLVRVARCAWGAYFFQPSGMLRAAGIPAGNSRELIRACKLSGNAVKYCIPEASIPAWYVDLDGYRDYIARQREEIRGRLDAADLQDGDLGGLEDTEDALGRLEECVAECEGWIASHEDSSAGQEAVPAGYDRPGDDPADDEPAGDSQAGLGQVDWAAFMDDPFAGPVPPCLPDGPVEEAVPCPARRSLIPKGPAPGAMVDALLDRLPLLCRAFGVSQDLGRDRQLAWIIWLMMFRNELVDGPDEGTGEAFLWRGRALRDVEALVNAAMVE